jgi:hypothetical protein
VAEDQRGGFLVSGIAGTVEGVIGEAYRDGSGSHDEANRGAVADVKTDELDLVGIAFRAERKTVDKVVDRLRFHP